MASISAGPAGPTTTPVELGFDPADPAFVADPYPVFRRSLPVRV